MESTEKMKAWKQKLLDAKSLQGESGGLLWQRVTLLAEIYHDDEFRADHGGADEFRAAEILDSHIADTCATFLELENVLREFPERAQWQDTPLKKLLAQVVEKHREARQAAKPELPERRSATVKELDQAVKDKKQSAARAEFLDSEVKSKESRIVELERENRELRQRLSEATVRIRELEESPSREVVAA